MGIQMAQPCWRGQRGVSVPITGGNNAQVFLEVATAAAVRLLQLKSLKCLLLLCFEISLLSRSSAQQWFCSRKSNFTYKGS